MEGVPLRSCKSKAGPACPDLMHKPFKDCVWLAACYSPSWIAPEPAGGALAMSTQAQSCIHTKKCTSGTAFLSGDVASSFVALLRSCAKKKDLLRGTKLHHDVLKRGLLKTCSDALVTMYAKCGVLAKAKELLYMHKSRDVVSWTALIAGYTQRGHGQDALDCFDRMRHEGLSPDAVTFACILKACGNTSAFDKGKQIHDEIARQGLLKNDIVLGNALVDMYAKCGAFARAQEVLEQLPIQDVVSWNGLIAGYAQQGQAAQALDCFEEMQSKGLSPDAVTFSCILKACGGIKAIEKGEQFHDDISRQGLLRNNIVLGNALVDMYAKCGALSKAQQVLEELPARDIVSWSALIAGYAQQGQGEQALHCYERMQREGLFPNAVTFVCILKACGSIGAADRGEQIHNEISRQGLLDNVVLGNALVDMYAKCGALGNAQEVFEELPVQDIVAWNALIAGYAQHDQAEQALSCFERMQEKGLSPDAVSFLCILKACGSIGAADKGEQIHEEIARQGLLGNDVLDTAVVDMYAKCGALTKARQLIEELPGQNVAPWNALIGGYAQQGKSEQALQCFECMQSKGLSPDTVTLVCILKACGTKGLIDHAQMFFWNMSTIYGIKPGLEHFTCMVDVLGRAGYLEKAAGVIQNVSTFNYTSALWPAMLGPCCTWGDVNVGRWAFEHAMQVANSEAAAAWLLTNVHADAAMQEEAEIVEALNIQIRRRESRTSHHIVSRFG